MTAILSALGAGVSANQILNFIASQSPNLGNKIQRMLAAGLSAEKVVNFFTNKENFQELKADMAKNMPNPQVLENPLVMAEKVREGGRTQDVASVLTRGIQNAGAAGLGLGVTALGAYAVNRALPFIAGQLGAGNAPVTTPTPMISPDASTLGGVGTNNTPTQAPAPGSFPVPGAQGAGVSGAVIAPNAQKHVDIIKQLGLEPHIQRQRHLSPQDIAATIDFVTSPGQKKWLAEQTSSPLEQVVSDYLASMQGQQEVSPEVQQPNQIPVEHNVPAVAEMQSKQIETPKPEIPPQIQTQVNSLSGKNVGSVVSVGGLPGRIESIKKDIAKVNVDGKIRHLKLKDVEEAPEDVQQAVIRMLQIPEADRSAVTAYFGYSPEDKSLAVQYHNGNLYTYDNVDEAKVHKMANKLGIPTTTGGNIFGEWEQGKQDSVGAALIAEIVKDPMYAKENRNKTWRKYETGYDYWEKLRKKPKPKPPKSKTERTSKKPRNDSEHGDTSKKSPEKPR